MIKGSTDEKEFKHMEGFTLVLSLLSGVALFLFGMSLMGDGLKKTAGEKLEHILYKLTSTPLKGILLGTAVTAVIQSSSATTVMVVGFVNAGLMKVAQAIGIIMGANIGTSITGWVICLSYIDGTDGIAQLLSTATISAFVAVLGIVFKMFVKREVFRNVGDIMLGFAILMTGMQTMSNAVAPLKSNESFVNALTMFSNPFMGIVAGILFTAVLQSASASVGIMQALSVTGGVTFATAFPITMGIGVGAACPVLLSSIGTSKNAKRTALIYLLNDLFGMVFWSVSFYAVNAFVQFGFMDMVMNPVRIALLNTVFRVATILVLSPFVKGIEKLVFILIKDSPEDRKDQKDFDLLVERFLVSPSVAITQSYQAMNGMIAKVRNNIVNALGLLKEYSEDTFNEIQEKENLIDKYEDKLGNYLMQLTGREMTAVQNTEVSRLLYTISDFERMGDHASNISKVAKELDQKQFIFTKEGSYEFGILQDAVLEIMDLSMNSFIDNDRNMAFRVEPLREIIGMLCDEMKMNYVKRMQQGKCKLKQGVAFNDLITDLERISAHCSNVALVLIEMSHSEFDAHGYVKSIRERNDSEYAACFEQYEEKYNINGHKRIKKVKKEDTYKRKKNKPDSKKKK